jgi:hypothetical protein
MTRDADDGLYDGNIFSEDERRRIRRLLRDDTVLEDMAAGWRMLRWVKVAAAYIGSVLAAVIAYRTFRDGGGMPR